MKNALTTSTETKPYSKKGIISKHTGDINLDKNVGGTPVKNNDTELLHEKLVLIAWTNILLKENIISREKYNKMITQINKLS